MDKVLKGNDFEISYSEVASVDTLGNGMYKINLVDGTFKNLSLDRGEQASIRAHLRFNNTSTKSTTTEGETRKLDEIADESRKNLNGTAHTLIPKKTLADLERSLKKTFDVELVDDNLCTYWARPENVGGRIRNGYVYAKPSDIIDFDANFGDVNVGQGLNPSGAIMRDGLVLMITSKENRDLIRKINYDNRTLPSNLQHYFKPK